MISAAYKQLLVESHATSAVWGNGHGPRNIDRTLGCAPVGPILDYGCGKGDLVRLLRTKGYDADGYDPGVPEFQALPQRKYDLLVSFDVLEHIEPEHVGAVIAHMFSLADRAYLEIALTLAVHLLPDGRNAHLTVQPADWWLQQLPPGEYQITRSDYKRLELFYKGKTDSSRSSGGQ